MVAAAAVLGIALWCVALTGSRGGQLVVLTVLGAYFVKRYGFRGALAAAMVALPVLVFGGRTGEEAESSSLERIDLLYEGIDMIRAYPVLGVGVGQFIDHAYGGMTAHNSYVLAAAELGLPGSLLWMMLMYTSMKIPWVVATRPPPGVDAGFRALAFALCVAFAGMLVGVFFLSFCYKAMLFVYFGLSGALFGAVRRACPSFEVRVSAKEIARVAVADAALLVFVMVYSHVKGAHA
jgi:O-antigen ligase